MNDVIVAFLDGYDTGYAVGRTDGWAAGYVEGYDVGVEVGRQQLQGEWTDLARASAATVRAVAARGPHVEWVQRMAGIYAAENYRRFTDSLGLTDPADPDDLAPRFVDRPFPGSPTRPPTAQELAVAEQRLDAAGGWS